MAQFRMGTTRKLASEEPIGVPSPNGDNLTSDWTSELREEIRVEILDCTAATAGGARAANARWAVGVDILYGAFVFVKTCIRGGCAKAIPNLYRHLR